MDRRQLEQQIRRGFWRAAKDRIGFTDEQMQRLEQSSRKFDQRRRSLGDVERAQRLILREELVAPKGNQERVAAALDRLHDLQRQRLDLQGEEQRELATFMTPIQRARYAALQEQVRRRVESLRRARTDSMGPAMSLQG
jgi:hypothetical protein